MIERNLYMIKEQENHFTIKASGELPTITIDVLPKKEGGEWGIQRILLRKRMECECPQSYVTKGKTFFQPVARFGQYSLATTRDETHP